ncbi:MAG: group 1 truncated hemoglobin [Deltaproteobacteria bacterium]|nr:group 1 truncated hemoglobin [Deltaproteobacteria bacterium]
MRNVLGIVLALGCALGGALGGLVGSAACGGGARATSPTAAPAAQGAPALYDRIGGRDALVAIVDDFVATVVADVRITAMFAAANLSAFKAKLVDQLCEESGGPCKYTGRSMRDAHLGMRVKEADFAAFLEDLGSSLAKFKVPQREQAELRALLGRMHDAIVAVP